MTVTASQSHNAPLPAAHRISTACEKLAVSRATIYRWAEHGKLKLIRVGPRSTRVTDESLRQCLAEQTASAVPVAAAQ